MDLYLDDCADSNQLVSLLQGAGHRVETPRSAGLSGRPDIDHLDYAARNRLTLVTKNPADFQRLHDEYRTQGRDHGGILLVYQDNIRGKDMTALDTVRAIGNLRASGLPIAGEIHVLNHWR